MDIVGVKPVGGAGEIRKGGDELGDACGFAVFRRERDSFLGSRREAGRIGGEDEGGVGVDDIALGAPEIVGARGLLHGGVDGGDGAVFRPSALGEPASDGEAAVERGSQCAAVYACLSARNDFFEHEVSWGRRSVVEGQ